MLKSKVVITTLLAIFSVSAEAVEKKASNDLSSGVEQAVTFIKKAEKNKVENDIHKAKKKQGKKATFNVKSSQPPSPKALTPTSSSFKVSTGKIDLVIPKSAVQKIKIGKSNFFNKSARKAKSDHAFEVGLPNSDRKVFDADPKVASDNSIVYLDYEHNTDVIVQAFEDSAKILTILNGADAPTEYSYEIHLPAGGELQKEEKSGAVIIVNNQGEYMGGIAPPWAIDDQGKEVATHYEIRGNTVVQVINHTDNDVAYPVVADPYFGIDLINYAQWTQRPEGWTFMVFPTLWARAQGSSSTSYIVGLYGWSELYNRYKNSGLNTNLGGMKDQYICHQEYAYLKSSWNLDEWRPNVSYAQTVLKLCNP